MVSKRQKLARKRFKEANPELFSKPPAATDAAAKNKKKAKRRRRPTTGNKIAKDKNRDFNKKSSSTSLGKHPLRVPGMRPGESCFICKSPGHLAKFCPEKAHWQKNKICLLCRKRGHSLKDCPEKSESTESKSCYNCGEAGHSLSKCPKPLEEGGTKFAKCFVCNEHGHLSKDCPKNARGIYPMGGSCKICNGVTHLAKNCPNKDGKNNTSSKGQVLCTGDQGNLSARSFRRSGDDLDDDFTIVEDAVKGGKKDVAGSVHPVASTTIQETGARDRLKPNKRTGPKIVNFFG